MDPPPPDNDWLGVGLLVGLYALLVVAMLTFVSCQAAHDYFIPPTSTLPPLVTSESRAP